ncbi:MAG TPA: IS4 family transposase [Niabella sp.]|nr:IS4 family transposase [Niabella sp.]HRB64882.1 IS4 family transposase [Niabella sp.]
MVIFLVKDYKGGIYSDNSLFREKTINEIIKTIQDDQFVSQCRTECGRKGFSRNRKLTFAHLIVLLVQGLTRSLQRELNSFYQKLQNEDFSIQYIVKSSFTKARAKLKHTAFVELNKVCLKPFYDEAPYRTWHGYRLLAVDGSTAMLPNSKDIQAEFGLTSFGPYADSPRSVARCSVLYDVLNLTVLDAQLDQYKVSERQLAYQHLPSVNAETDIILFDRGYPGVGFMHKLQQTNIKFIIRLRENWWLEARKMITEGIDDQEVTYATKNGKELKCRLVLVDLSNGQKAVVATNLFDKEKFPADIFQDLYHLRWNIEEGYKLFKTRANLEAFSGKTALSVRQDFFAKVFMMSLAAVLSFPIEERIRKEQSQTKHKNKQKINRTNALAFIKYNMIELILKQKIRKGLSALDKILSKTKEIVRPGRTNPRKKIKKKPPSSNYKHL